jgi:hypothetical protein
LEWRERSCLCQPVLHDGLHGSNCADFAGCKGFTAKPCFLVSSWVREDSVNAPCNVVLVVGMMEPGRAEGKLGLNGQLDVMAFLDFEPLNVTLMKDAIVVGPL